MLGAGLRASIEQDVADDEPRFQQAEDQVATVGGVEQRQRDDGRAQAMTRVFQGGLPAAGFDGEARPGRGVGEVPLELAAEPGLRVEAHQRETGELRDRDELALRRTLQVRRGRGAFPGRQAERVLGQRLDPE
jgi:hypothetical protein